MAISQQDAARSLNIVADFFARDKMELKTLVQDVYQCVIR